MRILIGYDGTEASRTAIEDLSHAGFPENTEAFVMSVAEAWDHVPDEAAAHATADEGVKLLRERFPSWRVNGVAALGSPAAELVSFAEHLAPDMIIVGEPLPPSGDRGFFLGQNTQKLITDSDCSVRVCRSTVHRDGPAARILIGFDGSRTSLNTIDTILKRTWPAGTKVRLVTVADGAVVQAIGRFAPQMTDAVLEEKLVQQWANSLAAPFLEKLGAKEIEASIKVRFGNPKTILPDEAREWQADAVFVGPHNAPNSFARFLIGSVSSAVAARAACTVEIVRSSEAAARD